MDEEINKIADHYGFTSQANMLIEESADSAVRTGIISLNSVKYH